MRSLFIYDWEAVSPSGIGKQVFSQAVKEMLLPTNKVSANTSLIDPLVFKGFDKKAYLGKKGVRGMDALGAYACVASHLLVNNHAQLSSFDHSRIGVVLGTGTGSVNSQVEFIRDLHVQECAEWVNPLQFPQTVINCAASQVSIWHRFTGVNTTVSSGYHSGISALEYAANSLQQSRVDRMLVGCAEEYSPYSKCMLPVDDRDLRSTQRLGEGCVMFLVGRKRLDRKDIEVFGLDRFSYFNRYTPEQQVDLLIQKIYNILEKKGRSKELLRRICFNRFSSLETEIVETLMKHLSAAKAPSLLCSNDMVADCLSATAGFQIGLLAATTSSSVRAQDWDLSLTFDPAGKVAISLLSTGVRQ